MVIFWMVIFLVSFVIARERSDRGDLPSLHSTNHKHQIATPLTRLLVKAPYRIGAGNDRSERHREGANATAAIYRMSCSSSRKQNEASPCFQSAVPRTLNWRTRRVEGTIHPSITLSTVPSTSPYDDLIYGCPKGRHPRFMVYKTHAKTAKDRPLFFVRITPGLECYQAEPGNRGKGTASTPAERKRL